MSHWTLGVLTAAALVLIAPAAGHADGSTPSQSPSAPTLVGQIGGPVTDAVAGPEGLYVAVGPRVHLIRREMEGPAAYIVVGMSDIEPKDAQQGTIQALTLTDGLVLAATSTGLIAFERVGLALAWAAAQGDPVTRQQLETGAWRVHLPLISRRDPAFPPALRVADEHTVDTDLTITELVREGDALVLAGWPIGHSGSQPAALLSIWDTSDPMDLRHRVSTAPVGPFVDHLARTPTGEVIASTTEGFVILDPMSGRLVGHAGHPNLVSAAATDSAIVGITGAPICGIQECDWDAGEDSVLNTVVTFDPSTLTMVGSMTGPWAWASDIVVRDGLAYVAHPDGRPGGEDRSPGVSVIDVSRPERPELLDSRLVSGELHYPWRLALLDQVLAVGELADLDPGAVLPVLQIATLAEPNQPQTVAAEIAPPLAEDLGVVTGLDGHGSHIFSIVNGELFATYVGDPTAPASQRLRRLTASSAAGPSLAWSPPWLFVSEPGPDGERLTRVRAMRLVIGKH